MIKTGRKKLRFFSLGNITSISRRCFLFLFLFCFFRLTFLKVLNLLWRWDVTRLSLTKMKISKAYLFKRKMLSVFLLIHYTYHKEDTKNTSDILCIVHSHLNEMLEQHSSQLHVHSVQIADRNMYQWSGSDLQSSNSHSYIKE